MKIAVSGNAGFVGRNLCELLDSSVYEVIPIDITNGFDLSERDIVKSGLKFEVMVHLANLAYVPASYDDPELFYRINLLTTLNALELCRKNSARLIYLSSYIYGNPQYLPIDESHPLCPLNPYAQTKFICESMCQGYSRDFGVTTTIFRPFNIYGIDQSGQMLIPEIINQLKNGKKEIQLKDPFPRRDYINVVDVVRAIKLCIDKQDTKGCEAYNICSRESFSVKEITEIINNCLTYPVKFSFGATDRPNEVNETRGSYQKFYSDFSWQPTISFRDGIKQILLSENLI